MSWRLGISANMLQAEGEVAGSDTKLSHPVAAGYGQDVRSTKGGYNGGLW
jgi:hypothetical protein